MRKALAKQNLNWYSRKKLGRNFLNDVLIDQLVERYRAKQSELDAAIKIDQHKLIRAYDSEIVSIFEQILSYDPKSKSEFLVLCKFLIDEMLVLDASSMTGRDIGARLFQLIEARERRSSFQT